MREADDADHEQSRLKTGSLVHRILRLFFEAKPAFNNRTAALKLAGAIARQVEIQERESARDPAFFDLEWKVICTMVDEVVDYECARRARGERPPNPQLEYLLNFVIEGNDATRITIEGAIDRLELEHDQAGQLQGLHVIDYKTSRSRKRLQELVEPRSFATTDLQLPIYLLGAIKQAEPAIRADLIAKASYIALRARTKDTEQLPVPYQTIDPNHVAQARDQPIAVAARIFALLAEARAGRFDVDPLECSEWCAYRTLCRFRGTGEA